MDILLVGTYTQHDAPAVLEKQELGEGIYLIPYNETLGGVTGAPLIIRMQNPSWVCLVKNRLFAVSESEAAAEIVEYEVRVQEERLTAEQKAGLQMTGKASCHIEKDEKGQRLFVSDYGSGDLKVIDISEAGSPKLLQEKGWIRSGRKHLIFIPVSFMREICMQLIWGAIRFILLAQIRESFCKKKP